MFTKLLLQDPISILELFTILLTALYILKLAINNKQGLSITQHPVNSSVNVGSLYRPFSLGSSIKTKVQEHLSRLFDVGELISLPKRSLRSQKPYR